MKIVLGGSRFLQKIPQNLVEIIKEWKDASTKEVWEGEVTEITPEEVEDPHGGYGKVV